ncbi:unnamed protein product [Schistosoma mattheei]|uniref:Uncharacterized protein n=1 Tax=Schistosoma mattheei TaxID=31246 RepID=A0A183Q5L7_9TREM|nr:unnamed protein product [Schistosoma mattheei]
MQMCIFTHQLHVDGMFVHHKQSWSLSVVVLPDCMVLLLDLAQNLLQVYKAKWASSPLQTVCCMIGGIPKFPISLKPEVESHFPT